MDPRKVANIVHYQSTKLDATPPGLTTGSEMIQQRLEGGVLLCVKIKSYAMSFLASNRGKVEGNTQN